MEIVDGSAFHAAASNLRGMESSIRQWSDAAKLKKGDQMDDVARRIVLNFLDGLRKETTALGLRVANVAIDALASTLRAGLETTPIAAALKGGVISYEGFAEAVAEIDGRIRDELKLVKLFVLKGANAERFDNPAPFGAAVQAKFPTDAAFEIDEASKCLALGRPTAAVFHLMRTMEVGIRALAKCLGVPDPVTGHQRNWGKMLEAVRAALNAKWPNAADKMKPEYQTFDALYVSLDAVKNPWRNATMHIENKYTDAEAEHIFSVVKGFMERLASRCDENGEPKV